MSETHDVELFWTAGQLEGPVSENRERLHEILGKHPSILYLEPRPGALLVPDDALPPPLLSKEWPPCSVTPTLDEARLFTAGAGLHAIYVGGSTRYLSWVLSDEASDGRPAWQRASVNVSSFPIEPLDPEAGRRFGILANLLPVPGSRYTVHEYRRNGELFCWNLTEGG